MVTALFVLVAAAGGTVYGLLLGKRWRDALRSRLRVLEERMDAYRLADARTDLDVVGPVTGEHQAVDVEPYDVPVEVALCAWFETCGRPAATRVDVPEAGLWNVPACAGCKDGVRVGDIDLTGELPAVDDDTGVGTVAYLRRRPYDQATEEPLCAWALDGGCSGDISRVDLPGARDVPACAAHVALARIGDVALADALPDQCATTYQRRLG